MIHYIINQERNIRPYAEMPLADHVNKSRAYICNSCLGAKVPGSERVKVPGKESSTYGTFAPRSESTWERKFRNSFIQSNLCIFVTFPDDDVVQNVQNLGLP